MVFTARGLTRVYEMGEVRVEALRGVDFDLTSGEFVVLLGHQAQASQHCSTFSRVPPGPNRARAAAFERQPGLDFPAERATGDGGPIA